MVKITAQSEDMSTRLFIAQNNGVWNDFAAWLALNGWVVIIEPGAEVEPTLTQEDEIAKVLVTAFVNFLNQNARKA